LSEEEDKSSDVFENVNNDLDSDSQIKLKDIVSKFREYLFLNDTKMLECMLAVVLSNQLEGSPLWVIYCGASDDAKSTQPLSTTGIANTIKIDEITTNTFASGRQGVSDLGSKLQENSHIFVIPDLACLSSKYKDDKKKIFATMRNLYDGFINKRTGAGVNRKYENCHVSMIAGATYQLKREYLIHQNLGSRELIFDTGAEKEDNWCKMDKAWENEKYEKQMKQDLRETVLRFISGRKIKKVDFTEQDKNWIKQQANKLSFLRAIGNYDKYNDELKAPICPKIPTRLVKQLKRLWLSLKSLDDNYSDNRVKSIIKHIVESSASSNRLQIFKELEKHPNLDYTINDMKDATRIVYRAYKRELNALWNLGIVNRTGIFLDMENKKAYDIVSYRFNESGYRKLIQQ
jgi:hypothetical protein